jgi:hypothetical protein
LEQSPSLNVQTHTPVTSIITSNDGTSIVHTPRGTIRAQKIVFATNGYTTGIVPEFEKKIVPIKISCSHISAPEDSPNPPPQLTHTYGLSYTPSSRDYLIPRPDGGVICGGARYTYKDDQKLWFNRWDDSTVLEATRPHFESVMQKNFRGWEKSGAAVDYLWSGSKFACSPSKRLHRLISGPKSSATQLMAIHFAGKFLAKRITLFLLGTMAVGCLTYF